MSEIAFGVAPAAERNPRDGDGEEDRRGWTAPDRPAWPDRGARSQAIARWHKAEEPAAPELSQRELEVLRLLAGGESTADIARELAYSESMIKHVVHGVVNNIGARNRAHAVALAIRAGLI